MNSEQAKAKTVVNKENERKVYFLLQIEYHQQRIETLHKLLEKEN